MRNPRTSSGDPVRVTYTVREVAQATGMSRTRLYGFIKSGELPTFKVGRTRFIRAEALLQLLDELQNQSNIDKAALQHAQRVLKEWLPAGKVLQHRFLASADDGPENTPGAPLSCDLGTGAWVDARVSVKNPVRGIGLIALFAHLKRISKTKAAAEIALRLIPLQLT